jgi:hypothetical protein
LVDEVERLRAVASERKAVPEGASLIQLRSLSVTEQPAAATAKLALLF